MRVLELFLRHNTSVDYIESKPPCVQSHMVHDQVHSFTSDFPRTKAQKEGWSPRSSRRQLCRTFTTRPWRVPFERKSIFVERFLAEVEKK